MTNKLCRTIPESRFRLGRIRNVFCYVILLRLNSVISHGQLPPACYTRAVYLKSHKSLRVRSYAFLPISANNAQRTLRSYVRVYLSANRRVPASDANSYKTLVFVRDVLKRVYMRSRGGGVVYSRADGSSSLEHCVLLLQKLAQKAEKCGLVPFSSPSPSLLKPSV